MPVVWRRHKLNTYFFSQNVASFCIISTFMLKVVIYAFFKMHLSHLTVSCRWWLLNLKDILYPVDDPAFLLFVYLLVYWQRRRKNINKKYIESKSKRPFDTRPFWRFYGPESESMIMLGVLEERRVREEVYVYIKRCFRIQNLCTVQKVQLGPKSTKWMHIICRVFQKFALHLLLHGRIVIIII